jgi:hypothetical protein
MTTLFIICAVLGGTILVCQTLLTLLGLAGDSMHLDLPHDVGHDVGGDFHADAGGLHDAAGHADSAAADGHDAPPQDGHGSSWLFAMISFRTVIAAMAFFGLAGLAARDAGFAPPAVLGLAASAGFGAMYGVYWMMQCLYRLRSDGTVRVRGAVGRQATVYLRIPAERSGMGKILINLQNRTMEYDAMTSGKELPTGTEVVVVNLISSSMLEVQAVPALERNNHV